MFGILRLLRQDDRWHELDKALTAAFEKVKADTKNVYSWIRYLRDKELRNDARHERISHELGQHDAFIKSLQMEMAMLREELKNIQRNSQKISPFPDQVRTKSGLAPKSRIERRIMAISRPVKKDYIMRQIMDLVDKGSYSTNQIETVIVKEKMLCGRTAFYDYLKELKLKKQIKLDERGSRKVLIPKDF